MGLFRQAIGHDDEPHWTQLKAGPQIHTPLNDWVGRALYYFGDLDPKLSWICQRLLRQGDTMIDIGANLGVMSLIGRSLVGSRGAVHAFEPQPALAALLRQSAEKNNFYNLHVHDYALGAIDAIQELSIPDTNLGAASLTRSLSDYREVKKVPVAVKQTSSCFDALKLGHIRLIKMDVEGYEPEVIRGGLEYFQRNSPDAIVFELNDHHGPFFDQPVVKLLDSIGYAFLDIPKAFWSMRLKPITDKNQPYGHDILAVSQRENYDGVMGSLNPVWHAH